MKRSIVLLSLPLIMIAKTVSFNQALNLTIQNNKELKAKSLDIKIAELTMQEPDTYKKGKATFNETFSRTNNAGYVFGMKLASREANFGDFGFTDFLGGVGQAIQMSGGQFSNFAQIMGDPNMASKLLATQPDDLNNPGSRNNFETKFEYEIPLFTGYKLENAKTMAKLQLKAKEAKFSHDKKKIGIEVLKAYNGAVTAKRFISMLNNAASIARRFQGVAQDMYDNGLTRYIDVQQAKMAAYAISTKAKEARSKYKLALAYLRFLTSDKRVRGVRGEKRFKFHSLNLETLQGEALAHRDDLKWMDKNVETMKTKIAFDSSDELPTVGVHAEYGLNDNDPTLSLRKDYYLVAVGFKQTLFDGELTSLKKQKARVEFEKTREYRELMEQGVMLEVEKHLTELKTNMQTLKDKQATAKMANDILEEIENIYKNNLKFRTNMQYLLLALQSKLEADADVIMSKYNKNLSAGQLKLALGKSLGE